MQPVSCLDLSSVLQKGVAIDDQLSVAHQIVCSSGPGLYIIHKHKGAPNSHNHRSSATPGVANARRNDLVHSSVAQQHSNGHLANGNGLKSMAAGAQRAAANAPPSAAVDPVTQGLFGGQEQEDGFLANGASSATVAQQPDASSSSSGGDERVASNALASSSAAAAGAPPLVHIGRKMTSDAVANALLKQLKAGHRSVQLVACSRCSVSKILAAAAVVSDLIIKGRAPYLVDGAYEQLQPSDRQDLADGVHDADDEQHGFPVLSHDGESLRSCRKRKARSLCIMLEPSLIEMATSPTSRSMRAVLLASVALRPQPNRSQQWMREPFHRARGLGENPEGQGKRQAVARDNAIPRGKGKRLAWDLHKRLIGHRQVTMVRGFCNRLCANAVKKECIKRNAPSAAIGSKGIMYTATRLSCRACLTCLW